MQQRETISNYRKRNSCYCGSGGRWFESTQLYRNEIRHLEEEFPINLSGIWYRFGTRSIIVGHQSSLMVPAKAR